MAKINDTRDQSNEENNTSSSCSRSPRRDYLKNIGALTTSTLLTSGSVIADNGPGAEVVILRNEDGPVKTRAVPQKWKKQNEAAKNVKKHLEQRLLGKPGIRSISIVAAETSTRGMRNKAIEIGIDENGTNAGIQERVDGVPIKVSRENMPIEWHGCYENDYNPAKGGVSVSSGMYGGSAMARAHKDQTEYLFTARHLYIPSKNPCEKQNTSYQNKTLYQPQGADKYGNVKDEDPEQDWVAVKPNSDEDTTNHIVNEPDRMFGWVDEEGYSIFLEDESIDMHVRGDETCTDVGTIKAYNATRNCSNGNKLTDFAFVKDIDTYNGDSGGVIYYKEDGYSYVAQMISGRLQNGPTFGVPAYEIRNQHGYVFW